LAQGPAPLSRRWQRHRRAQTGGFSVHPRSMPLAAPVLIVRAILLELLLLAAVVVPASAADKSKFRKCSQGAFCKRYKKYVKRILDTGDSVHALDPETISHEGHIVRARLAHVHGGNKTLPLSLELGLFRDSSGDAAEGGRCGIVRLTVTEEAVGLHPRFRLHEGDVVSADLLPDNVVVTMPTEGRWFVTSSAPGECTVALRGHPFELDVAVGGRVVQRLNARHLLNFEQYRAKGFKRKKSAGLVDATDVDSDLLWDEPFDAHVDSKPRGPAAVGIDVTFSDAPVAVGLAEHASRLHLGLPNFTEPYRLFNLDVFEYEMDTPMALYGSVPLVTAVHMWPDGVDATASGFLVANPSEGFVKVEGPAVGKGVAAYAGNTSMWWVFESGVLDVFCFLGPSPQAVLRQYHLVTGWPRLPLLAALGKHQSRWNYIDTEDVIKVDKGFDAHGIPYDFLWLDLEHTDGKRYFTWDPKHFAGAGPMLDELTRKRRNLVTIIDPHIKKDSNYTIFTRLQDLDLFTRGSDGKPYEGFCWPGDSYYPDFCNPAAREEWSRFFTPDVYPHSRPNLYSWNDMNEPSVFNGPEISMPRDNLHKCHAGNYSVEHRDVHNVYGLYHHAASVHGQLMRAPGVRPFVLTRSFFAGTHRHGPVWTGDNAASWSHLSRSVPMLVSLALCGLSFAGADVPGFFGDPDPGLFVRWHQLGVWYPFYRAHAHLTTKRREPWLFGEEVTALVREAVLARYQLLPMWYTLAAEWALRGSPMLRPIWYHDLSNADAYAHADNHFFVGEAMLVRAIERPATEVEVYLPNGEWFDYWEEAARPRKGGRTISMVQHPGHVPVFVRSGHIIMRRMRPRRSAAAMVGDPYTVFVYGTPARGRIYIDDGLTHDFETGAFLYDELEFDGAVLRPRPADTLMEQDSGSTESAAARIRSRLPPAVPQSGLRIERVVFVGLPQQPLTARALRSRGGPSGTAAVTPLPVAVVEAGNGESSSWTATVRDPAVLLGHPQDWTVELGFGVAEKRSSTGEPSSS